MRYNDKYGYLQCSFVYQNKRVKIYFKDSHYTLTIGRKSYIISESDQSSIVDYINYKYHNNDKQKQTQENINNLIKCLQGE